MWPFNYKPTQLPSPQEMAQGKTCRFHPQVPAVIATGGAPMCADCYARYQQAMQTVNQRRGKEDDPYYDPEFPTEEEQDAADEEWWDTVDPANINPPESLDELHPWAPGHEGKGILLSDGSIITWVDKFHHQQVAQLLDPRDVMTFLDHIHPDGFVLMDYNSSPQDFEAVSAAGLHPDTNQWRF
jgi:hypothetical protein